MDNHDIIIASERLCLQMQVQTLLRRHMTTLEQAKVARITEESRSNSQSV